MSGVVVVVGGGVAGCAAARVLHKAGLPVLLLEAGAATSKAAPSADPFDQLLDPSWLWPDAYLRGRGLGGGSAVNGMVLMAAEDEQLRRWAGQRLVASQQQEWDLLDPTPSSDDGRLSAAFRRQVTNTIGREFLHATWLASSADGRRRSAAALLPEGIEVVGEAEVAGLAATPAGLEGVVLSNGDRIQARHVVLAAGAIRSPQLLLEARLGNERVGWGLKDHPGLALTAPWLTTKPQRRPASVLCTGDQTDMMMLPFEAVGAEHQAMLLGVLLAVHGAGTVSVDGIDFGYLRDDRDRLAMRRVARRLAETAARLEVDGLEPWVIDDAGTQLTALPTDADGLDQWLAAHRGPVYHAACSCRFGAAVGPGGVVLGARGVSVVDASVLPDLPRANPQVVVSAMAALLAADLASVLS